MTFRWRKSHRMIVWQISKDYLAASSVNEERLKLRMSFTYVSTSKCSNNWYERHRHIIDFDILTRIRTHTWSYMSHSWRRPEILTCHQSKVNMAILSCVVLYKSRTYILFTFIFWQYWANFKSVFYGVNFWTVNFTAISMIKFNYLGYLTG